jgi:hypothetical protein
MGGGVTIDAAKWHRGGVVGPDQGLEGRAVDRSVDAVVGPVADHVNRNARELSSQHGQRVKRCVIGQLQVVEDEQHRLTDRQRLQRRHDPVHEREAGRGGASGGVADVPLRHQRIDHPGYGAPYRCAGRLAPFAAQLPQHLNPGPQPRQPDPAGVRCPRGRDTGLASLMSDRKCEGRLADAAFSGQQGQPSTTGVDTSYRRCGSGQFVVATDEGRHGSGVDCCGGRPHQQVGRVIADLLEQGLQTLAGSAADLVPQGGTGPIEGLDGVGRPTGPVQGHHQMPPEAFLHRALCHRRLDVGYQIRPTAKLKRRVEAGLDRGRPQGGEPSDLRDREVVVREFAERVAMPQRQRLTERLGRAAGVATEQGGPARRHQRLEPVQVHRVVGQQIQAVTVGPRLQSVPSVGVGPRRRKGPSEVRDVGAE